MCVQVIESLKHLNMSGNGLFDLSFLVAFVGIETLNLNDNRVASKRELDYISHLKELETVQLKGNVIYAILLNNSGVVLNVQTEKYRLNHDDFSSPKNSFINIVLEINLFMAGT